MVIIIMSIIGVKHRAAPGRRRLDASRHRRPQDVLGRDVIRMGVQGVLAGTGDQFLGRLRLNNGAARGTGDFYRMGHASSPFAP
jgi:hypothetical protein